MKFNSQSTFCWKIKLKKKRQKNNMSQFELTTKLESRDNDNSIKKKLKKKY